MALGDVVSRDWLAVYAGVLTKSKYRRLSIPARAALFHVWMLAGAQSPEATFDRDELRDVLELDGWDPTLTQGMPYALDVIDELIEKRWLDVDEDARLLVHDWDDHQLAATNAARRAYERDRKRDWRRPQPSKASPPPNGATEPPTPLSPAPLSPDITGAAQGHHITTQVSRKVRDKSGTRPPSTLTPLSATLDGMCPSCSRPTSIHLRDCPVLREQMAANTARGMSA